MIEAHKTVGMFPTSLPGHYFEGPIKAHYRPRRLWLFLLYIYIIKFLTNTISDCEINCIVLGHCCS